MSLCPSCRVRPVRLALLGSEFWFHSYLSRGSFKPLGLQDAPQAPNSDACSRAPDLSPQGPASDSGTSILLGVMSQTLSSPDPLLTYEPCEFYLPSICRVSPHPPPLQSRHHPPSPQAERSPPQPPQAPWPPACPHAAVPARAPLPGCPAPCGTSSRLAELRPAPPAGAGLLGEHLIIRVSRRQDDASLPNR